MDKHFLQPPTCCLLNRIELCTHWNITNVKTGIKWWSFNTWKWTCRTRNCWDWVVACCETDEMIWMMRRTLCVGGGSARELRSDHGGHRVRPQQSSACSEAALVISWSEAKQLVRSSGWQDSISQSCNTSSCPASVRSQILRWRQHWTRLVTISEKVQINL